MGKLIDIYGLYVLCTTYIGKVADIYRLYVLLTPSIGELADIYGIIFLFLVKRLHSIDVISELQEYFLFPNFIKVYPPTIKPAQQKM